MEIIGFIVCVLVALWMTVGWAATAIWASYVTESIEEWVWVAGIGAAVVFLWYFIATNAPFSVVAAP